MNQYLIHLSDIEEHYRPLVGGKAWRLALLQRAGGNVPPAMCITNRAWEKFLHHNRLTAEFEEFTRLFATLPEEKLVPLGEKLAQTVEESPFPPELSEVVEACCQTLQGPFAVRSSGVEEDMKVASFAGMHQSFLHLERADQVQHHIRRCWASLLSPEAIQYRIQRAGRDNHTFKMGVLIQEMVEPELSGILFTRDPVLGTNRQILDVCRGVWGEEVAKENFQVDRDHPEKVVRKTLAEQEISIPDDLVSKLAEGGLEIEELFGDPQDIEWIYRDDEIYILQSRPISSLPDKDECVYWTSANSQEVLWKPVTPLTFSFFMPYIEQGRRDIFEHIGIDDFPQWEYLKLFYGRPYFNINYFNRFLEELGVFSSDLFDTLIFGEELNLDAPLDIPPLSFRLLRLARTGWKLRRGATARLEKYCRWLDRHCRRPEYTVLSRDASPSEILSIIEANAHLVNRSLRMHVLGTALAGAYFIALGKFLQYLNLDPDSSLWTALARGIPGIRSAEEGRWILDLARMGRRFPAVEHVILNYPLDELRERLQPVPGGNDFLRELDRFLGEFGHRTLMEADLITPRWHEDPTFVLQTIRKYLELPGDLSYRRSYQGVRQRESLTREVLQRLSFRWIDRIIPWKRAVFQHLIDSLVQFMPYRENIKDLALKPLYQVRRGFLQLGDHFVREGHFRSREDVFFLKYGDVAALSRGAEVSHLTDKITQGRKEYEYQHKQLPPRLIVIGETGRGEPTKIHGDTTLSGLGCSPGIATGPARVITNNDDVHSLRHGEILVTRAADPKMTPLFPLASALILDVGGTLSHSVVVAREYGLPCVTGLRVATQKIKTGDEITVDGGRGLVYLSTHNPPTGEEASSWKKNFVNSS